MVVWSQRMILYEKKLVKAQVHIRRLRGSFGGLRWTHPSFSYQKVLVIEECSSQDRARSMFVLEVKVYQALSIRQWIVTTKSYVNQVDRTFTRKPKNKNCTFFIQDLSCYLSKRMQYFTRQKMCLMDCISLNFRETKTSLSLPKKRS